jgi:hypothetical protein
MTENIIDFQRDDYFSAISGFDVSKSGNLYGHKAFPSGLVTPIDHTENGS